jgi:hypothetical protein
MSELIREYPSPGVVLLRRIGNPTAYVAVSLRCKTPVKALLHVEQGEMVCLGGQSWCREVPGNGFLTRRNGGLRDSGNRELCRCRSAAHQVTR